MCVPSLGLFLNPKLCIRSKVRARRGEEPDVDPEQSRTPTPSMASFPAPTNKVNDEGADSKPWIQVGGTVGASGARRQ